MILFIFNSKIESKYQDFRDDQYEQQKKCWEKYHVNPEEFMKERMKKMDEEHQKRMKEIDEILQKRLKS